MDEGALQEVVTVTGAGKTIYLAGVGAEDENAPAGASAPVRHLGNPYEQCRYAYDKIKRLLATHGASLADAVKQVVYVTDVRFQADVAKCRREAYGDGPITANTFLVINALAIPRNAARDRRDRGGRQMIVKRWLSDRSAPGRGQKVNSAVSGRALHSRLRRRRLFR